MATGIISKRLRLVSSLVDSGPWAQVPFDVMTKVPTERFETATETALSGAISMIELSELPVNIKGMVTAKYWDNAFVLASEYWTKKPRDLPESAPVLAQELFEEFAPALRQCHIVSQQANELCKLSW